MDVRAAQVETGRLTRVNWGRRADPGAEQSGSACGSVCFSWDPPTRSPANQREPSGNTAQVFWDVSFQNNLKYRPGFSYMCPVFAFAVC